MRCLAHCFWLSEPGALDLSASSAGCFQYKYIIFERTIASNQRLKIQPSSQSQFPDRNRMTAGIIRMVMSELKINRPTVILLFALSIVQYSFDHPYLFRCRFRLSFTKPL